MTEIRILLEPRGRGRYAAFLDDNASGDLPIATSGQPFYQSARVLLERGHDPTALLIARHRGSPVIASRQTIGEAAKWTVSEPDRGTISIRRYDPEAKTHLGSLSDAA